MNGLDDIVAEIEEEASRGRISGKKTVDSIVNQPSLLTISSANTISTQNDNGSGFSSFTVNLPRPIVRVDSVQMLNSNIPQCTQNIPNTACVFWYYRLSEYSGLVPNPDNLFMVRLLPSYYNPEFINNSTTYGFNRTFVSYSDLATELALACQRDLTFDHIYYQNDYFDPDVPEFYTVPFLPNDISLTLNTRLNKFQMTGNNTTSPLVYVNYDVAVTYSINAYVKNNNKCYISLRNSNIGNPLPVIPATSTAFWKEVYLSAVTDYDATTPYRIGQYVSYSNVLYQAILDTLGNLPTNTTYWTTTFTATNNYRYLITGPQDPNVLFMQGNNVRQWNPYNVYRQGEIVQYNGVNYTALKSNKNFIPFVAGSPSTWSSTKLYNTGDLVSYSGTSYIATQNGLSQTPSTFSTYWNPSTFWTVTYYGLPNTVGLATSTFLFDYVDTWNDINYYPFPVGQAGQPFNPNPKRILNTILGFTWNGLFTASSLSGLDSYKVLDFSNIRELVSYSNTVTQLFNRLRPVPQYFERDSTGLGDYIGTPTASVTPTFTAEGYANLNFTSVVSLYTNILTGSTMDTQQNNNLLATAQMNCANLGVSFCEPKITNELMMHGGDLYSMTVSMFDEFNEPYIVTNNAVVTIVLRLTYKDRIEIKNPISL
jgi:hypothetical protein